LGYHRLNAAQLGEGDPVTWALGHARIAAGAIGVIEIVNEVRSGKVPLNDLSVKAVAASLARAFKQMGVDGPNKDTQPGAVTFNCLTPEALGDRELQSTKWIYDWEPNPIGGAYELLAWLVNPIIKPVHYEFRAPFELLSLRESLGATSGLTFDLHWNALLEVIYWQIALRMGGDFRRCKLCGRVFPANGKKKFCSTGCMNKVKCRKYRAGNQEELNARRRKKKWRKQR
jgi:hypothetical protein